MAPKSAEEPTEHLKCQIWVLRVSIHCQGCKRQVKKLLQSIAGVYTTCIDSEQHKVTVTGDVKAETLIKKLLKKGKHAEIWPEKFTGGENKPKKGAAGEKGRNPEGLGSRTCAGNELKENPCQNGGEKENFPGNNAAGDVSPAKVLGEKSEIMAAERTITQGSRGEGHGGKKDKKKGQKGNSNTKVTPLSDSVPASTESRNSNQDDVDITRQHPDIDFCIAEDHPEFVMSYNAVLPSKSSAVGTLMWPTTIHQQQQEHESYPYPVQSAPLDPFKVFSDENPNGCNIM